MEIQEALEKFGLSKKETCVYLACVELDDSPASEIALKSSLPRTLVYDILERLITLGIISYAIKNNKKYFSAADPKELVKILEEKRKSILQVMPELEKLKRSKGVKRPKIEIYEGKEGMKTVMNSILRSDVKEFLAYGSSKSSFGIIPAFMEEWHKQRIKKKVLMRVIYNNSKEARERVKKFKKTMKYANYKFMPINAHSPTAIIMYGNKVILQSWTKEPFAVVTESKEMADNQRKYFEELWKLSRK